MTTEAQKRANAKYQTSERGRVVVKKAQKKYYNTEKGKKAASKAKRKHWLKSNYDITPEEYDQILDGQGQGCYICGKTVEAEGKYLAVDHCEKKGHVRGLLCKGCNMSLGHFQHSKAILFRAIAHLDRVFKPTTCGSALR